MWFGAFSANIVGPETFRPRAAINIVEMTSAGSSPLSPSDCAREPSEASDVRGSPPQKSGRRPPRVAAGAEQPPSPAVLTKREETGTACYNGRSRPRRTCDKTGGLRPHHAVPQALPSSPPGRRQLRAERRGCVRAFSAPTAQSCSDPAKAINRLDDPWAAPCPRGWSRSNQVEFLAA
jgi:hypothetical protein